MTNRNRLLYALALLPALLLTSCYKDFNKVRIKPFKPDLVVPLAAADNITFADMLVKENDLRKLDSISYKKDGRIGLRYDTSTYNRIVLELLPSLKKFTIKGGNVSKEELFRNSSADLMVQKIFFAVGAEIQANRGVTLSLEDGSELKLNKDFCAPLKKVCALKLPKDASNDCVLTFKDGNKSVDSVEVKIDTLQALGSTSRTVTLGAYAGLLWYSGELTDPRVAVQIETTGWAARVEKLKYWVEGSSVKTRVDGKEEDKPLIGRSGENPLPFNEKDKHEFLAYWKKGATQEKEYFFDQTSMVNFSKDWPLSYTVGKLAVECKDEVVTVHAREKFGTVLAKVALKLPFTGRFNALIRELKGGDKRGNIELPDVNKLLQDSGSKGGVKSRFTDNDKVLLHFYFKNATPMEIYLATKVGDWDPVPKGAETKKVADIENVPGSKIGEQPIEGTSYTLASFNFFKAVGGAKVAGPHGIVEKGAVQTSVATIEIPYSKYEKARKSASGRQLTALLLFRSPNGTDGEPIIVSPRLSDFVSIRLGVEVKPEVSIELMNKE